MSESVGDNGDPNPPENAELLSDPTRRREYYRQISVSSTEFNVLLVPTVLLWLQDSWSEIRKDCARWIRCRLGDISPEAERLLLSTLVDCIRSDTNPWQAIHGSLLGITEMIQQSSEVTVCDVVRTLCLSLVGSNLAPVREAATACVSKLVASGQISTAVLISNILSSIMSIYSGGGDMAVANELDGLLGCLCDTIQAALSGCDSNLPLLFKAFDDEFSISTTSQAEHGNNGECEQPLLIRVISIVYLLMDHASSIVRQNAGQVFLYLYNLLPEEDHSLVQCSDYRDICRKFIKEKSFSTTTMMSTDSDEDSGKPKVFEGSRGGLLSLISSAVLDNRKWERQEVCLIISEEILHKVLLDALSQMSLMTWNRVLLSEPLHILLASARTSSCSSFLHSMFEIRRMHGQILPAIARATIIFQPDLLLDELKCGDTRSVDERDATGLGSLLLPSQGLEGRETEKGGLDCRAIVFCVWVSSLCNAAEHICELDPTHSCAAFQDALSQKHVSSAVSFESGGGISWAMDVAGRHSEEMSKKQYAAALKSVLCGGNVRAYAALSISLSCVKALLIETFHLFWSTEFLSPDGSSSSSSSSSSCGRSSYLNLRKVLLPQTISCDFIDAAALSAALLLKLDPETLNPMKEHTWPDELTPLRREITPNCSPIRHREDGTKHRHGPHSVSSSLSKEQEMSSTEKETRQLSLKIPVFLLLMRAVMRKARDISNGPQALSRGSSCRSTPLSSPMKSFQSLNPCRIDMSAYGNVKAIMGRNLWIGTSSEKTSNDMQSYESPYMNGPMSCGSREDCFESPLVIKHCLSGGHKPQALFDLSPHQSPVLRRRHSISKIFTRSPQKSPALRRLSLTLPKGSETALTKHCWALLPSLTDPTTDLSKGLLKVESSAVSEHRWLCESLAPLLPCLVCALSPLGCAILAPIVADWALSIASNSLWMDSRILARKALFTSLPLLVEKACPFLVRHIELSDSDLHDAAVKETRKYQGLEEQVHAYLSETTIACIAALCADTPGLDPHSVGCLLRTLRLCRVCPAANTYQEGATNTFDDTSSSSCLGSTAVRKDKNNLILTQLKCAMTAYSLKHARVRAVSLTDDAIAYISLACSDKVDPKSKCQNGHIDVVQSEEDSEDNFSDWDEDEEAEIVYMSRKGSFCFADDISVMEEEIGSLTYMIS